MDGAPSPTRSLARAIEHLQDPNAQGKSRRGQKKTRHLGWHNPGPARRTASRSALSPLRGLRDSTGSWCNLCVTGACQLRGLVRAVSFAPGLVGFEPLKWQASMVMLAETSRDGGTSPLTGPVPMPSLLRYPQTYTPGVIGRLSDLASMGHVRTDVRTLQSRAGLPSPIASHCM